MLGFCRNMAGGPQSQPKIHQKWHKKSQKITTLLSRQCNMMLFPFYFQYHWISWDQKWLHVPPASQPVCDTTGTLWRTGKPWVACPGIIHMYSLPDLWRSFKITASPSIHTWFFKVAVQLTNWRFMAAMTNKCEIASKMCILLISSASFFRYSA